MPGQDLSVTEQLAQEYVNKTLGKSLMEAHEKQKAIDDSMKRLADMKAEIDKELEWSKG